MPARFGQVVIGPPGSGKTTYVHGLYQFYSAAGRPTACINLDPANELVPYPCAINLADLIRLEEVMEELDLGPNGGLIYCLEYLEEHVDWLLERLAALPDDTYLLIDTPGQVELTTHNTSLKRVVERLVSRDYRLCCVHLADSHYCVDPAKYIAVLLLSLKTMIHLELPHINVLSKMDLLRSYGKLALPLEFYTDVQDLGYLLEHLNADAFGRRFGRLNEALICLVEDYSLVAFHTLCIHDKASVLHVATAIDKANGYVFGELDEASILQSAATLSGFDDARYAQDHFLSEEVFETPDPGDSDDGELADGDGADGRELT